jgi:glyoxylase-like metal-dependent hydrolase (beta-lactamase superfamily II)
VAAWAALALLSTTPAIAQPAAAPALVVRPIKEGKLYWVEGGGGNSGVIIGDRGVIVIDAKITPEAGRALVAEVAKLTPKPITHLIETHGDGDHVNGVVAFPAGVKIIAHVNNRDEQLAQPMLASVEVDGGKCLPPKDRAPDMIVYNDRVSTTLDGEPVVLLHYGPAHTSGDLMVYLPEEKVVFTGDILTSNVLIHPEKGGSLDGWFRTAKALLALDATAYVPGHAAQPDTKAMLARRIADLQASRDKVRAMLAQGKSLAETKAAMGDPPKDSIGCRGMPYPSVTWTEYQDGLARSQELK